MAGTLRKLKRIVSRLKGGAEAVVAVPFELKCECGATVAGRRRKSWIESECPECFQSLYVLPANVYPATKSVPSEVLGGTLQDRLKVVFREIFPKKKKTAKKPGKDGKKKQPGTESAAEPATLKRPWFVWPKIDVFGFLRRVFSPFRLLMVAMIAVVGLTIYWMTLQSTLEAARQTWLKSPEEIEQRLESGEMLELQQTLDAAVEAADILERDDPESRRVRNLLEETVSINTIASSDLLTGFHNAYGENGLLRDDAEEEINDVCRSGTFVFDSWLQPTLGLSDVYSIDFPATPGRHPVEIIIPLPAVGEFYTAIEDGRAVFAARIGRVETPKIGTYEPWTLHVEATSMVLMTSLPHCEYVGFSVEDDPSLATILERQMNFVETSTTWQHRAKTAIVEEEEKAVSETDR